MNTHPPAVSCCLTFVMMLVTACGGAAGGGGDPSSAVKAAFDAAGSGGLAKLDDFACAAEKGKVAEMFGGAAGMEQLTSAGVDPNQRDERDLDQVRQPHDEGIDPDGQGRDGPREREHDGHRRSREVQADPEDRSSRPRACPTTTRRSTRR